MKPILFTLLIGAFITAHKPVEKTSTLQVTMTGMRNDKGSAMVGLYKTEDGFPTDLDKAFKGIKGVIKNGGSVVTFEEVPQGTYAIAVLHDEDDNMKMARKFTGLPDEEYGFSNDAKATFGPPIFDKASFVHTGQQVIAIRMKL